MKPLLLIHPTTLLQQNIATPPQFDRKCIIESII